CVHPSPCRPFLPTIDFNGGARRTPKPLSSGRGVNPRPPQVPTGLACFGRTTRDRPDGGHHLAADRLVVRLTPFRVPSLENPRGPERHRHLCGSRQAPAPRPRAPAAPDEHRNDL